MTQPKITIVTPFRSFSSALERTMASVQDQDRSALTHVLVHAGRTVAGNEQPALPIQRSSRLIRTPGVTLLQAMHAGLSNVRTGYVCVLQAGDVLLPGTIERVMERIVERPHTRWLTGRCLWIDASGRSRGSSTMPTQPTLESILCETGTGYASAASFLHIDLFNRCGKFDADLTEFFALDLDCRLLAAGYQPTVLGGTIAAACVEPVQNRMQWVLRMQERCEVIRRHAPSLAGLRRKGVEAWCDREESQLAREMARLPVSQRMRELLRRIENRGWPMDGESQRHLLITPADSNAPQADRDTLPLSLAA